MIIQVDSTLDISYGLDPALFQITSNEANVTVATAQYDSADSSHQTIKLTLPTSALLDATTVNVSIVSGTFQTSTSQISKVVE